MEAVRSVWADNFAAEADVLHAVAPYAVHAAFNVQYPGCVVAARRCYDLTAEEQYQVMRANADALKPLQLSLAVRTVDGRLFAWEFNMNNFDLATNGDSCDHASISYLRRRGMDFNALPWSGVDASSLRFLLLSSGLLISRMPWATFAGAHHVAYFAKIMLGGGGRSLPAVVREFEQVVLILLGPDVYDVKVLARDVKGSLIDVARPTLGVD